MRENHIFFVKRQQLLIKQQQIEPLFLIHAELMTDLKPPLAKGVIKLL